jgi:hypothetical protein
VSIIGLTPLHIFVKKMAATSALKLQRKMHNQHIPNGNFFGELTNFGDLTILTNHFWCEFLVII